MSIKLREILDGASRFAASDVHLSEGHPPTVRVHGILRIVQAPPLDHETMVEYLNEIMPPIHAPLMEKNRCADFAYCIGEERRYRVSSYYERGKMKIVLRNIPMTIPTLEEIDLPETLKTIALLNQGMVLVTGATGSGKSTSLASMIQYANSVRSLCIITIEDPIEFVHHNNKSIVTQREVGVDVLSFNAGLVQALRQDPDVILIGEMRDVDTMRVAIKSAETGHLVFSTLHTTNAVQTVERIIATFNAEERDMVREQIAYNMKSAISQRLVRRVGGQGRIAAMEIMIVNGSIQKLIYDDRIRDIPGIIAGRQDGMMKFDQSLADLVRAQKVDQAEAETACDDVAALRRFIKGKTATGESGGIIGGW
ncbi:TPA: twitching motility protein PilT [Candidatus Sumerlaeota bacterium]|jgi:twitching motility protein PilT|nr:twitching motility protein PilT [Candidatus Sumerlaeota bacterium]